MEFRFYFYVILFFCYKYACHLQAKLESLKSEIVLHTVLSLNFIRLFSILFLFYFAINLYCHLFYLYVYFPNVESFFINMPRCLTSCLPSLPAKRLRKKCHTTKIQLLRFVKLHLKTIWGRFSEDCRNFASNVPKQGYINMFKMVKWHMKNLGNWSRNIWDTKLKIIPNTWKSNKTAMQFCLGSFCSRLFMWC